MTSTRGAVLSAVVAALAALGMAQAAVGQTSGPSSVFDGTNGPELISGTDSARGEFIQARGGNDRVNGFGGDDRIIGGRGDDLLFGGRGNDLVLGGSGDDTISGGFGRDSVNGGAGRDNVFTGFGNDYVASAGNGVDYVDCGPGLGDYVLADRDDQIVNCEQVVFATR